MRRRRDDRELQRIHWTADQTAAYLEAERRLCRCEAVCTCRWDDPDSLAMRRIERDIRAVTTEA